MMLMRTDPFRDFDRLAQQVFGTTARPAAMPMDAWQEDGEFVVAFDLPGRRTSTRSDSTSSATFSPSGRNGGTRRNPMSS